MTTISSLLSSLINDLQGLEQAVSQINSGNSSSLSNFSAALGNVEATAQQAISANSPHRPPVRGAARAVQRSIVSP
jgi:hypothetical protein